MSDTVFTAFFDKNEYTLTTLSNDSTYGETVGDSVYLYLDTAIALALPAEHYHFMWWEWNGTTSTDNPCFIPMTDDIVATAHFAIDTHQVTVQCNDTLLGTVQGDGLFEYGASATVEAAANPDYMFVRWSDGSRENPHTITVLSDTLLTAMFEVVPEMCMVTVEDEHCKVVWHNYDSEFFDSINVYCERSQAGVFELVGTVAASDANAFVDQLSNPSLRAYRYRIAASDSEGNESEVSGVHKTAHLSIVQAQNGWLLQWTSYEGIDFSQCYIYRGHNSGSFELIDSIPGNINSYLNPVTDNRSYYYVVEFRTQESCLETKVGYSAIRTNVVSNGADEGVEEAEELQVSIYPNPTKGIVAVEAEGLREVVVLDMQGRVVMKGCGSRVDLSAMASGTYLLRIITEKGVATRRVMLAR